MRSNVRTTLPCRHTMSRKEHGFVSTDGQRLHDTQTCLDLAEGRTPAKPDEWEPTLHRARKEDLRRK